MCTETGESPSFHEPLESLSTEIDDSTKKVDRLRELFSNNSYFLFLLGTHQMC